jgi:hypothetical protein
MRYDDFHGSRGEYGESGDEQKYITQLTK